MRKSSVTTNRDAAGEYESEVFDCENPKSLVICVHGNGVRRWDGEEFFSNVANNYPNHAFYLVDLTQPFDGGCELIDLKLMVARVEKLIAQAKSNYPDVEINILAHSMGCGVSSLVDTEGIARMILVAPAGGDVVKLMVSRYGEGVLNGGMVKTSDGLNKLLSKAYVDSVGGIVWEEKYENLLKRFKEVYAYESGEDEIVTEERRAPLRTMPFATYKVIEGATHNLHGDALKKLYSEIDNLI